MTMENERPHPFSRSQSVVFEGWFTATQIARLSWYFVNYKVAKKVSQNNILFLLLNERNQIRIALLEFQTKH